MLKYLKMQHSENKHTSGDFLLADFQTAIAALATADYAQSQAQQTENAVMSELNALGGQNYLNPGAINPVRQEDIGRASLNAHVMKVQAAQIQRLSQGQLNTLQAEATAQYVGKKVTITALEGVESPFDAVWFNDQTGYRSNPYNKLTISGKIEDVQLAKNLLIVKPKLLPRLINRDFTAYYAYVINPGSLQPAVSITLS